MRQLETEEHSISIRNLYRVRIVLLFHLFYSLTIHQYHNIVNQASGIRLGKRQKPRCTDIRFQLLDEYQVRDSLHCHRHLLLQIRMGLCWI